MKNRYQYDFVILTQDEDFLNLSLLRTTPPKFIPLKTGNLPSAGVVALLQGQLLMIYTLLAPKSEVNCLGLTQLPQFQTFRLALRPTIRNFDIRCRRPFMGAADELWL